MEFQKDIIWNEITDSAKSKVDFKNLFSAAYSNPEKNLYDNILFMCIVGYAVGQSESEIIDSVNQELCLLGILLPDDFDQFLKAQVSALAQEIKATRIALESFEQGLQGPGVLISVRSILNEDRENKEYTRVAKRPKEPELSDECRSYVGLPLNIRFLCRLNTPWTQVKGSTTSEYVEMLKMNGVEVEVVPLEFFAQKIIKTRGFLGRISKSAVKYPDCYVVAAPATSGMEFNFTDKPCPDWRIWMSKHKLPIPTKAFRQMSGIDMIAGYGCVYDPSYSD